MAHVARSGLAELLGGRKVLGKVSEGRDFVEAVRHGLPYASLEALTRTLGRDLGDVGAVVGIPGRTACPSQTRARAVAGRIGPAVSAGLRLHARGVGDAGWGRSSANLDESRKPSTWRSSAPEPTRYRHRMPAGRGRTSPLESRLVLVVRVFRICRKPFARGSLDGRVACSRRDAGTRCGDLWCTRRSHSR